MNLSGNAVTPSVPGINPEGKWVIGEEAKAQALLYPEKTAIEVKRKIGSGEKITLGDKSYTAQELSAKLLTHVRKYASKALGEKNQDRVKNTASAAIFLAVCAWLLISAACLLGVRWYFDWQSGGNEAIAAYG